MINLVVIPDIHGISDWRFPVTNALKDPNAHIVFLGDYVDTHVQGNDWKIFENLKEIINIKKKNPDRITLLIGNHDAAYVYNKPNISGFNYFMQYSYRDIFNSNWNLFQLAWGYQGKEKYALVTHAGLTNWFYDALIHEARCGRMNQIFKDIDFMKLPLHEFINYFDNEHDLIWTIGISRGGMSFTGSILWADMYELVTDNYAGIDQIVGHTNIRSVAIKNILGDKLYFVDNHDEYHETLSAFSIELD